ncbi:F-box/FBD/LRR-repeat protein At1g13570-like [Coffea eugenioides]|uniref:F-box/FBD/LRR-repeat protein At1g13570-like n=1 Tax=Coffea eugenioides TaxID=49369 RepID=UPI000F6070D5|nr:F-box/FBD/LRR-repeat protein At1g13570-like [Coffea eugenioides]
MDAAEMSAVDRLSNLPINVIQNIIGCMPIRDAARTSILSSKWRYVWAEYPELVLDKQFYTEMVRSKSPILFQPEYVNIVNGILFQHLGPILKFVLDIPELQSSRYSNIDQWLLFVSRKDVTKLTLHNRSPNRYKVPSYAFSGPKLAHLNVTACIFSAPKGLDGCRKLTHLSLTSVTFEFSVLNFPQLFQLSLQSCSGIHLLSISAPSLKGLILLGNDGLDLSNYITCKDLVLGYFYLFLVYTDESNRIKFDEKTLQHLKEPGLMKESLNGLKTVIIRNFKGSTAELFLVKLLLACSPSLERMCIQENQGLDPIERLNISKELMQFSRASPKAEMFFRPFGFDF